MIVGEWVQGMATTSSRPTSRLRLSKVLSAPMTDPSQRMTGGDIDEMIRGGLSQRLELTGIGTCLRQHRRMNPDMPDWIIQSAPKELHYSERSRASTYQAAEYKPGSCASIN